MVSPPFFHPAVSAWFDRAFAAPTAAQAQAWPAIQSGRDVLIAAPTGSGKTLAAFLAAIDGLVRQGLETGLKDETQVVYVSPLKALSNDIQRNLEAPLAGIREALAAQGLPDVEIRSWVRTGDTPAAERQRMQRRPPHILVTTPESLYILRRAALPGEHRPTLIFVNPRRLAGGATRQLADRLGADRVRAHHGSLAKEQRFEAEQRLKRGELTALVATASLELGIDIGDVDLVCQLGSTRSIAAFLQRVGRSGHAVGGMPKGRLFPLSRDELVECASLLDAVRREELDRIVIPEKPLDVLAQQIVAEVSAQEWSEDDLFELCRRAYPF